MRCIGCGSCVRACPFGVLPDVLAGVPTGFGSTGRITGHKAAKCDLCTDRTTGHDDVVPRCVSACPTGALMFVDEHQAEKLALTILGARTTGRDPYKRR